MPDLLAIGLAFLLGVRHGAGPDHLAAVASLVAGGGGARRSLGLALRFAIGHSLVLLLAGGGLAALGGRLPPAFERVTEAGAGVLLVGLGLASLRRTGRYVHLHVHAHEGGIEHAHPHAHEGIEHASHSHPHAATALGGAFALSGLPSHLLNVAPLLAARGLLARGLCAAAFGAGIVATMAAFGLATREAIARSRSPRLLSAAISSVAAALGAVWVARSLAG